MEAEQLYTVKGRVKGMRTFSRANEDGEAPELSPEASALLDLASARALDPSVFDETPPVFFDVYPSTNVVDAYWTIMGDSSLKSFAAGAERGVQVLDSHDSYNLGIGRSLTGEFVTNIDWEGEKVRGVLSTFFTIPGIGPAAQGGNANAYINGIKSGIYSDISVGFSIPPDTGRMVCSICGGNMLDWSECEHFAGINYAAPGKAPNIAIGTIEGAILREYSVVYDGATPGAAVAKAIRMAAEGYVDPAMAEQLTAQYGRSIVVPRSYSGATQKRGSKAPAAEQRGSTNGMEIRDQIINRLIDAGAGVRIGAADDAIIASLGEIIDAAEKAKSDLEAAQAEIANLTAQNETLEGEAEDGRAYRNALVERGLTAMVRSLSEERTKTFNRDTNAAYMRTLPVTDLEGFVQDWEERSQFEPGRQSSEGEDDPTDKKPKRPKMRGLAGRA